MSHSPDFYIHINGKIVKSHMAAIPAVSSGLYYGAGCFETMRRCNQTIFRFGAHINRLNSGLLYLGVEESLLPKHQKISEEIEELIEINGLQNESSRVRIQVSLIETEGYRADKHLALAKIITCKKINETRYKPAKLIISDVRAVPDTCRPAGLKLSNMLHFRNAFRQAAKTGADDALLLTVNGHLAESSMANLFWKKENRIYTPSADCDILPGIMRNAIIEIIKNRPELELIEGRFRPGQLDDADAIWLTNSIMEIRPVEALNGRTCPTDHAFVNRLKNNLHQIKEREKA